MCWLLFPIALYAHAPLHGGSVSVKVTSSLASGINLIHAPPKCMHVLVSHQPIIEWR